MLKKTGHVPSKPSKQHTSRCFILSAWSRYMFRPYDIFILSLVHWFCDSNNIIKVMLNLIHLKRYSCYLDCVPSPVVVARDIR